MQTFMFRLSALIATSALLVACSTSPKSDSKIGVDISGVNYSDQPITYIVSDPNDKASVGAEPLDPFAGGGSMCCFRLPATWQPGIKVRVEILDTNRKPFKEEIVDLPPYVDGKPGRLWAVLYQDGSVEVLSSEYGPPHAKWPGKVKGWPVPTVEYRRKLWERDLKYMQSDINATTTLIERLEKNPEESLQKSWAFDKQYRAKDIERFSGPNDPEYIKYLRQRYEETLSSRKQRLDYWMKKKP
jgi:hypothetical protein